MLGLTPNQIAYLDGRAALYGGNYIDMLHITPSCLDTGSEVIDFWQDKDLSHIMPQSQYPSMAHDWHNIIPEDHSANIARGGEVMTPHEMLAAQADNMLDAQAIDNGLISSVFDHLQHLDLNRLFH